MTVWICGTCGVDTPTPASRYIGWGRVTGRVDDA